jgi:hypothetical protein
VQLSLLQDAVLATVIALVSVESQLCLLNLHLLGFLGLLSLHHSQETVKAVKWGNCRAQLICFLSFRDHCALLSDLQCLEKYYLMDG